MSEQPHVPPVDEARIDDSSQESNDEDQPSGGPSHPDPQDGSKKKKDPNAKLREELKRQREQKEAERQRQKDARARRNFERLAKAEELRQRQEERRQQAEEIQKQAQTDLQKATNRTEFERDSSEQSSSEESLPDAEESFEDLPGERYFLRYFKEQRDHSPTREELLVQVFDPNMDSIQAVMDDLSHAELELSRGSYPRGEDLEELFNVYRTSGAGSPIFATLKEASPSSGDWTGEICC